MKFRKITALFAILFVLILSLNTGAYASHGFSEVEVLINENNVMIISADCEIPEKTVAADVYNPDGKIIYINDMLTDSHGIAEFRIPLKPKIKGDYRFRLNMSGFEIYEDEIYVDVSSEADILNFSVNGYAAKIKGSTVSLTLNKKSLSGLIAEFELSDKAVATVDSVVQISGVTKNDFEDDVKYVITAEDGTRKVYTVSVSKKTSGSSSGGSGGSGRSTGVVTNYSPDAVLPPQEVVPSGKPTTVYADVADTHWAYEYVKYLSEKGIINGDENGNFNPDDEITREQFVKMLVGAVGIDSFEKYAPFDDVDRSSWYAPYVAKAYENGIVTGIDATHFGTGLSITREQMFTLIYRSISKDALVSKRDFAPFPDWDLVSEYAMEGIQKLYEAEMIDGGINGALEPLRYSTRAEAAKLIYMLITKAG